MLPSVIYTAFLASALVSAVPLKPVENLSGNSVGDVLSGNKFDKVNVATVDTEKTGLEKPADSVNPGSIDIKPVTDAVPPKPDVEGTIPNDGKPVGNAGGAIPTDNKALENLHLVKQSVTDGKVGTFKPEHETPFDFKFLGGICCYNNDEVLEKDDITLCEIAECEMDVIGLAEGKKTTATTLVSDPKTGIMVPKDADAKDVKLPGTPQLDGTPSVLGGGKVDEVIIIAKNLGKKEKTQDATDLFVVYYYESIYKVIVDFVDPLGLAFPSGL